MQEGISGKKARQPFRRFTGGGYVVRHMIEFIMNGLSMYYTTVGNFQQENNWKVYTCDNGMMVGYYPGEPAHIEICDGDYEGIYEAGGDKVR